MSIRGLAIVAVILTSPSGDRLAELRQARPEVTWDGVVVTGDYDGDGKVDQAVLGHAPGRILVGIALSSQTKPSVLEFHVGSGARAAVCSDKAKLRFERFNVEALPDELSDLAVTRQHGLQLANDECDSVHLYWDPKAHRMNWWRR